MRICIFRPKWPALLAVLAVPLTFALGACGSSDTTARGQDGGGEDGRLDDGTDAVAGDGGSSGAGSVDGGSYATDGGTDGGSSSGSTDAQQDVASDAILSPVDAGPTGTFSGRLVFSSISDFDASAAPQQLYMIDLGSASRAAVPLAVTSGHYAYKPSFSQDGEHLFFTQVDGNTTSATYGSATLMKAQPDATNASTLATCATGPDHAASGWAGSYCGPTKLGADGNVWTLHEQYSSPALDVVPAAGGSLAVAWSFLPAPPCTVQWMDVSPDGTKVAFVLESNSCTVALGGVYVLPLGATSLGTKITPTSALSVDSAFVQFNRAGDRLYYIGVDYKLYSENLDGTGAQVVVSTGSLYNARALGYGAVVVNDGYFLYGSAGAGINVVPFDGLTAPATILAPSAHLVSALTWAP
jgi:hypothetical protein